MKKILLPQIAKITPNGMAIKSVSTIVDND